MKNYAALLLLFGLPISGMAQDEQLTHEIGTHKKIKTPQTLMFFTGLETSTLPVINTDTKDSNSTSLYVSAFVNYQHKSNFGISVRTYALTGGSDPGFYLTDITPYYANYNGKVNPYISYTRYITHNNPSVPYSPIQNDLYAHVRIQTNLVDPIIGVDAAFGKDEQNNNESVTDFNAFAAISRVFAWESLGSNKNQALGIIPTIQLNAGTDRYFKFTRSTKYISRNRTPSEIGYGQGRGGGNGNGGMNGEAEQYTTISEENNFTLSNAEINLYLTYFIGSFSIEPSGSIYFPLRGEDRDPYGYWQINLTYWIR